MEKVTALGIDAGGTHTDAVICSCGHILGRAKVVTDHDDLPGTLRRVLEAIAADAGAGVLASVTRATLGTTLLVNAAVQDRLDPVGLALSAGPGLSPLRFAMGRHVCIVPGGLDHRGSEVTPLDVAPLRETVARWKKEGVGAFACVSKFSPRNPAHETAMGAVVEEVAGVRPTLGHRLSGELNFPRRVASAYYNAAACRLHNLFLDAVEQVFSAAGLSCPIYLLRADGGAAPIAESRVHPVQSILSGPAASVMGVMALMGGADGELGSGSALLMDIGGTTTDLALYIEGSPVTDRDGMTLGGRRTLVRSLATLSIGVGGDSRVAVEGSGAAACVETGPLRLGPAMAFGGSTPTLLDALNVLNADDSGDRTGDEVAGDTAASRAGIGALAAEHGLSARELAALAWRSAADKIAAAIASLLGYINAHPIYTLRELMGHRDVAPDRAYLVGGPTHCVRNRLARDLNLPVRETGEANVANAIGAALTRPSSRIEVYADTGSRKLLAPALDFTEALSPRATLESVKDRSLELLEEYMRSRGIPPTPVEVAEADLFATLTDSGYGSRDIRVSCQTVPGILENIVRA